MLESIDISAIAANCYYSITRVLAGVCMAIILGIAVGLGRSLLPPKFDQDTGEKFPGNYLFNPYTGRKLATQPSN